MISHPLIYCDWLEEQGKNVVLLREDFDFYSQNRNHCCIERIYLGCGFYGSVSGDGLFNDYGDGYGWSYGDYFGDGHSKDAYCYRYSNSLGGPSHDYAPTYLL